MYSQIKRHPVVSAIMVIVIILNSSYAYNTVDDTIAVLFLGIASLIMFFWGIGKWKSVDLWQFFAMILIFGLVISMLVNGEILQLYSYGRQICVTLFAMVFVNKIRFDGFRRCYLRVLDLLCAISLIYLLIYNTLGKVSIFSYANPNYVIFDSIGLVVIQRQNPLRVCGPFWESGIFASFIVIGMIYEIYSTNSTTKLSRMLLYIFSIIMTQSTAGYFLGILALLLWYISKSSGRISLMRKFLVYAGVVLCFVFSTSLIDIAANALPDIFGKMTFESISMSTRISNPIIDLSLWMSSPIFGLGIRRYNQLWDGVAVNFIVGSRTSTATYFPAIIGVFGFTYIALILRGGIFQKKISVTERFILIAIVFAIITKEPHNLNLLMFIIIFYLNNSRLSKNEIEPNSDFNRCGVVAEGVVNEQK